jgi:hypothetical protein
VSNACGRTVSDARWHVLGWSFDMPNNTRRRNQPPTGEGKKRPRRTGEAKRVADRAVVVQAQRNHPELNLADSNLATSRGDIGNARPRRKAGR